jgi:hypothetical protein
MLLTAVGMTGNAAIFSLSAALSVVAAVLLSGAVRAACYLYYLQSKVLAMSAH